MQHLFPFVLIFSFFVCVTYGGPLDNKEANKDSKSAFGQAFDEIVVESHLTVRRKSNGRQARTQNVTNVGPSGIIKTKREIKLPNHQIGHHHKIDKHPPNLFASPQKHFGGSASNAQAQAFNSNGPLGNFGAAASGTQTQNFGVGPNGLLGSGAFAGTQQYTFNGQTIDIAFGNAVAGNGGKPGAIITVTGPDGKKRPLNG